MPILKNQKGQTAVEYLLLLAACFITAYLMIRGPVATFTKDTLTNILFGIKNVVTHGEWSGEELEFAKKGHPASPGRLKPLHL
jgi:Flp pilus assembly pilin Flp